MSFAILRISRIFNSRMHHSASGKTTLGLNYCLNYFFFPFSFSMSFESESSVYSICRVSFIRRSTLLLPLSEFHNRFQFLSRVSCLFRSPLISLLLLSSFVHLTCVCIVLFLSLSLSPSLSYITDLTLLCGKLKKRLRPLREPADGALRSVYDRESCSFRRARKSCKSRFIKRTEAFQTYIELRTTFVIRQIVSNRPTAAG